MSISEIEWIKVNIRSLNFSDLPAYFKINKL